MKNKFTFIKKQMETNLSVQTYVVVIPCTRAIQWEEPNHNQELWT